MHPKPRWSNDEIETLKGLYGKMKAKEVATKMRRSRRSVMCMADKLKLKAYRSKYDTEEATAKLMDLKRPVSCYLLGLIWADGCIRSHIKRAPYRTLSISMIETDMKTLAWMFDDLGKIYQRTLPPRQKGWQSTRIYSIHSTHLATWLADHDYHIKSQVAPRKILACIPENNRRYFLRGLSDGDGCWYVRSDGTNGKWTLTSGFDQDWSTISELFDQMGIKYDIKRGLCPHNRGRHSSILIWRAKDLIAFGDMMYGGIQMGLDRKRDKYLTIRRNSIAYLCHEEANEKEAVFARANPLMGATALKEALGITIQQARNLKRRVRYESDPIYVLKCKEQAKYGRLKSLAKASETPQVPA